MPISQHLPLPIKNLHKTVGKQLLMFLIQKPKKLEKEK